MRVVHELMMRPTKAMKVRADQLEKLKYPLYVSPKMDGIRCVIKNGFALSKKLVRLPNKRLQRLLSYCPAGFEGELIHGDPLDPNVFDVTQKCVMSHDAPVDKIKLYVFDNWSNEQTPFSARINGISLVIDELRKRGHDHLHTMPHTYVHSADDLAAAEDEYVTAGYEGVMLRYPLAHYKFGISTIKGGHLLKLKRWDDMEVQIVGFVEQMKNDTEPEIDDLGYIKRLKRKDTQVPNGVLGAFECVLSNGVSVRVGNGMSHAQRKAFWADRDALVGKWITIKYQNLTKDGVPRFPSFLRFRDEIDFDKEQ